MIPRPIENPNTYDFFAKSGNFNWLAYPIWGINHPESFAMPSKAIDLRRVAFKQILKVAGEDGPYYDNSVSLVPRIIGTELGSDSSANNAFYDLRFRYKHLAGSYNLAEE